MVLGLVRLIVCVLQKAVWADVLQVEGSIPGIRFASVAYRIQEAEASAWGIVLQANQPVAYFSVRLYPSRRASSRLIWPVLAGF